METTGDTSGDKRKCKSIDEEFWLWWQEEFQAPSDMTEFDAGSLWKAIKLAEDVRDFVWPDYKVHIEGSWVVFKRVDEKFFSKKAP